MSRSGRLAGSTATLGLAVLAAGLAAPPATRAAPAPGVPVPGVAATGVSATAVFATAAPTPDALTPDALAPDALAPDILAPDILGPRGLVLGRWPGRRGTAAAARYYGYPYPHPPACTDHGACVADKWSFFRGQCTSWVAYRLNQRGGIGFSNTYGGRGRWGNALHWGPQARKLGITVNNRPTVGAIAWYSATKPAPDGHVGYVEKVLSPTSIVMSEMNYDAGNGFWVHVITKATGDWPTDFIHVRRHS